MSSLTQICPKRTLGFEIQKTNVRIRITILRYHVYQFSDKIDNFEFLCPNLPKNGFWGQNYKNLSLDLESLFQPKFGEIAHLRATFWFKYYWGCCRELGGDWNELDGGWNELGVGGWSWVEAGARFSNDHSF